MSFRTQVQSQTNTKGNTNVVRTRNVQFWHSTTVNFIPGLSEISNEELEATWLTEKDIAKIQLDNLKTIKRMRSDKIDENKYCTRGLEYLRSPNHVEKRRIKKESVRNAVLTEQARQQQLEGYHDPLKIRHQSRKYSKESRYEAMRRGASDAAAVLPAKHPTSTCPRAMAKSDQNQPYSITQSMKNALSSAATSRSCFLEHLRDELQEHPDNINKSQSVAHMSDIGLSTAKGSSGNVDKGYSKVRRRATAA